MTCNKKDTSTRLSAKDRVTQAYFVFDTNKAKCDCKIKTQQKQVQSTVVKFEAGADCPAFEVRDSSTEIHKHNLIQDNADYNMYGDTRDIRTFRDQKGILVVDAAENKPKKKVYFKDTVNTENVDKINGKARKKPIAYLYPKQNNCYVVNCPKKELCEEKLWKCACNNNYYLNKDGTRVLKSRKKQCEGGICGDSLMHKEPNFVCKCVKKEKNHPQSECDENTCKVHPVILQSDTSIAKLKKRIICLCRKYSEKLRKDHEQNICEDGICKKADKSFVCKCKKKVQECTNETCSKEKYANKVKIHKLSHDETDQTGEPFFEMKVNAIDMSIVNSLDVIDKVTALGKKVKNKGPCHCPSHVHLMAKYKKEDHRPCPKGPCERVKKSKNKKTNFTCKCLKKRILHCSEEICKEGKIDNNNLLSSSVVNKHTPPLFEIKVDPDNQNITNAKEIRTKLKLLEKARLKGELTCKAGVCRNNIDNKDVRITCYCRHKHEPLECINATCDSHKQALFARSESSNVPHNQKRPVFNETLPNTAEKESCVHQGGFVSKLFKRCHCNLDNKSNIARKRRHSVSDNKRVKKCQSSLVNPSHYTQSPRRKRRSRVCDTSSVIKWCQCVMSTQSDRFANGKHLPNCHCKFYKKGKDGGPSAKREEIFETGKALATIPVKMTKPYGDVKGRQENAPANETTKSNNTLCKEGACVDAVENNESNFDCKCKKRRQKLVVKECNENTCEVDTDAPNYTPKSKLEKLLTFLLTLDKRQGICENGTCMTTDKDFVCKCIKKITECSDKTCYYESKAKKNYIQRVILKDDNKRMSPTRDEIINALNRDDKRKVTTLQSKNDQSGEPFFEMKVNSVDMGVLNSTDISSKIKTLGKRVKNESPCCCPSHVHLMAKYKKEDHTACTQGPCDRAKKNKKTNFTCKCLKKRILHCSEKDCKDGKFTKDDLKNSSLENKHSIPLFEMKVDPNEMNITNAKEIRQKLKLLEKARLKGELICKSGVCRDNVDNKDVRMTCYCRHKHEPLECINATCDSPKQALLTGFSNNGPRKQRKKTLCHCDSPQKTLLKKSENINVQQKQIISNKSQNLITVSQINCNDAKSCDGKSELSILNFCKKCQSYIDHHTLRKQRSRQYDISNGIKRHRTRLINKPSPTEGVSIKVTKHPDAIRKKQAVDTVIPNESCPKNKCRNLKRLKPSRCQHFKQKLACCHDIRKRQSEIGNNQPDHQGQGYCFCGITKSGRCIFTRAIYSSITALKKKTTNQSSGKQNTPKKQRVKKKRQMTKLDKKRLKIEKKMNKKSEKLREKKRLKHDKQSLREKEKGNKMSDKMLKKAMKKDNKVTQQLYRKERKKEKIEKKKEMKLKRQQMKTLEDEFKGKAAADETSCLADFFLGILKFCVSVIRFCLYVLFKAITRPKRALLYVKMRLKDPISTLVRLKQWAFAELHLKRMQMNRSVAGSEAMSVMIDEVKDSALYQAFAGKGRTNAEKKKIEKENRLRKIRIKQRYNTAVHGCRHMLLTTLRRTPCLWVYHVCPMCYPQCLSLITCYRNCANIVMFLLAFMVWTPCVLSFEFCRFVLCCFFCG